MPIQTGSCGQSADSAGVMDRNQKEIGRREGCNRKGKLGESLALVAGVAKGWLGWAGTRVGKGLIFPTPHVWGGGTNERRGIVH